MNPKMHKKQCPECKEYFVTDRGLQKVCSPTCAIERTRRKNAESRARVKARRLREQKKAIKTRSEHLKETQAAFNAWVRERDYNDPCISCGRFHEGQWHAGHYRSVGACPELRFDHYNVHKQCSVCNNHKSGNPIEYRIRLVEKIGAEQVARLEGGNPPMKYTIEELEQKKALYRRLTRALKKQREGENA